jgi:hypothetical protein
MADPDLVLHQNDEGNTDVDNPHRASLESYKKAQVQGYKASG